MNVTAGITSCKEREERTLRLLDERMQDFDELLADLLAESEQAFREDRLGFCAIMDSVVIPGVAAQSEEAQAALRYARRRTRAKTF